LLWFGWFGFNGGSALAADGAATLAFVNTLLAPAAALTCWMAIDVARTGQTTAVGAATGIVVGLVAVTPAAGFVGPMAALALGAIAVVPSYFMILYRSRTRLDDSLDVASAHGIGGLVGALLTGVLATAAWGGTDGLLAGNPGLVLRQTIAVVAVIAYSGLVSLSLLKLISWFAPIRIEGRAEARGLDVPLHGEEAYGTGEGAILVIPATGRPTPAASAGNRPVASPAGGDA
ncbi:MAG: ammonia channel protein, partial [Planctomycetota bacterium]|nr:ammonia channel protein [Planctomycetota bacterium]